MVTVLIWGNYMNTIYREAKKSNPNYRLTIQHLLLAFYEFQIEAFQK